MCGEQGEAVGTLAVGLDEDVLRFQVGMYQIQTVEERQRGKHLQCRSHRSKFSVKLEQIYCATLEVICFCKIPISCNPSDVLIDRSRQQHD